MTVFLYRFVIENIFRNKKIWHVNILLILYYTVFTISDEENNFHVVVNCGEPLLKNNTYWPLVSDFINILSHQSVAKRFLEDQGLLQMWMNFVSFFQGEFISKNWKVIVISLMIVYLPTHYIVISK